MLKANNKTNKLSFLLAKLNVMDVWSDLNMETDRDRAGFQLNLKLPTIYFPAKGLWTQQSQN